MRDMKVFETMAEWVSIPNNLKTATITTTRSARSSNFRLPTVQRISVGVGKMKIQGVSTCQFLCMNCKGLLYASRESGDECEFYESIEPNHYNTYYSSEYSNDKRRFYLALNGKGQPRKVMLRKLAQSGNFSLGNYSSFTMVLLRYPQQEPDEGTHPVRHHAHMCSSLAAGNSTSIGRDDHPRKRQPTCSKRKPNKRKKKPKCPTCNNNNNNNGTGRSNPKRHNKKKMNKKCAHKDKSEKCQRSPGPGNKRPRKFGGDNKKKQTLKGKNNKKPKLAKHHKTRVFTTELPSTVVTLTTEESFQDEDYLIVDNSTHWDVDSSTTNPDESTSTSTTTIVTHPD